VFTSQMIETNGQTLHVKTAGRSDAPVMVMLHGFPEYWNAWASVGAHFVDTHYVIMPDQRGFNLSSKPEGVANYDTKHMVADLLGLIDQLTPNQKIILCGHDWGASVAYAFAMRHSDRVEKIVIANGVHPICFQKALLEDTDQIEASQYMNVLRAKGSEDRLARENFTPLLNMFERFSAAPWLDENERQGYRDAWRQTGALTSMLNWYRGSQMIVPESGTPPKPLPITDDMREKYRITVPHLLIWGIATRHPRQSS